MCPRSHWGPTSNSAKWGPQRWWVRSGGCWRTSPGTLLAEPNPAAAARKTVLRKYNRFVHTLLTESLDDFISKVSLMWLTFHPFSKHLHVSWEIGHSLQKAGLGALQGWESCRPHLAILSISLGGAVFRPEVRVGHQGLELLDRSSAEKVCFLIWKETLRKQKGDVLLEDQLTVKTGELVGEELLIFLGISWKIKKKSLSNKFQSWKKS